MLKKIEVTTSKNPTVGPISLFAGKKKTCVGAKEES